MFRIDNSSAVTTLPVAAPPGIPGYFSDGNETTGVLATMVDAWWANMLQEEILSVVSAAGITPSKSSSRQLLDALSFLYLGKPALNSYLPLAGGTMTGFPLLLARDPVLAMEAATRQFVLAQVGGTTPTGFLPLTGGTLHNPGGNDPLSIVSDQGLFARISYTVTNTRAWECGCASDGSFTIVDATGARTDFSLKADGHAEFAGYIQTAGNGVTYAGLPGGGANNIGFVWSGGRINVYVDGLAQGPVATGNFLPLTGGTLTGSLVIGGTSSLSVGGTGYFTGDLTSAGNFHATGLYGRGITLQDYGVTSGGNILLQGHPDGSGNVLTWWDQPAAVYWGSWASGTQLHFGAVTQIGYPETSWFTLYYNGGAQLQGDLQVNAWDRTAITLNPNRNGGEPGINFLSSVRDWTTYVRADGYWILGDFAGNSRLSFEPNTGYSSFNCTITSVGPSSGFDYSLALSAGRALKSGNLAWETVSARERKTNIVSYERGLDALNRLRPVEYELIAEPGQIFHGLIADEVAEIMPEMVHTRRLPVPGSDFNATSQFEDVQTIDATPLFFALVNAVKELAAKIEALEAPGSH